MKLRVISISKDDNEKTGELFSDYVNRLKHYIPFETLNIKPQKASSPAEQQRSDASLLLKKLLPDEYVVLLDERGKQLNSVQLSDFITKNLNSGKRSLVFVVGGAYGFDQTVYERSNELLSLSKMTLPHQLAKVLLAEQLYRAFTILRNEKYHH